MMRSWCRIASVALVLYLPVASQAAVDARMLGARLDGAGETISFRVYSERATRIELCLYAAPLGTPETACLVMAEDSSVWSRTLSVAELGTAYGITGTVYYGYRAWGPNWPYDPAWTPGSGLGFVADVDAAGNRFNPNKLLFDPYAREISHDPLNPAQPDAIQFASGAAYRTIDSGPWAPKGIVLEPDATPTGSKPTRSLKDDVIYEVHLRGLTMNDPSVPAALRGTYLGAAAKAAELASLGITAVEFLPVQETQNDQNDLDPASTDGDNYWGYATLNYFAPDRRYASDQSPGGPTRELKQMVGAFHDHGIKVFVDVVYNHTGEGYAWDPADPTIYNLLSFRGLDNPLYYSLTADYQSSVDNTGVGGNYNTFNPVAQDLIVDSLAYWADELGVDGFRFDLASVLGNVCEHGCFWYDKLHPGTALNRIVRELPPRPAAGGVGTDFIAEPWAIGGNSYQVGNFPAGWSEWNDQFRDTVRRDQNKMGVAAVTPGELATRIAGSSDLFQDDGRWPQSSINFVVAHDGFTLNDLYAYNQKNNNQPWPYGPSDGGTDDNNSWDQNGVVADQRKAARNGMALLLLSGGTPMMTGGDECLRSLGGNNNPYNLDSVANWLSCDGSGAEADFRTFVERMIAFRRGHPALRPLDFYVPYDTNGNVMEQLRWFKPDGSVADGAYFGDPNNHALAWRIDGTELGDPAAAIYVAYNGWSGDIDFVLPWPGSGRAWYRVTDTSTWNEGPDTVNPPGQEDFIGWEWTHYLLRPRAVLVLVAK